MAKTLLQSHARQIGVLYLLYFVTAVSGGLLVKGLAVPGDAAATAQNFAAHHVAVNVSSALGLVSIVEYLALTALFYEFFRPVSRGLSLLATLLAVTACAIQVLGDLCVALLHGLAVDHQGIWTDAMKGVAQGIWEMHVQSISVALVLFGAFDLVIGILIFRATFLPRFLGVVMAIAGLGWLIYLWPPLVPRLAEIVQPLGFLAEVILMVWLIAKGADEERWRALQSQTES